MTVPIWRGSFLPHRRAPLSGLRWVFACTCCRYDFDYDSRELAFFYAKAHCKSCGGKEHHHLLATLESAESPLFSGRVA